MTDLDTIRRRLADAGRSRTASRLFCIAAELKILRLADHVAAGTMTLANACEIALAAEAAAHLVADVQPPENPNDRQRISL
jgi:hypothetical protein